MPGPAGLRRHRPLKPERTEIQVGHKGVEEADRMDVVVEDVGQEPGRGAIGAGDRGQERSSEAGERWPNGGTYNIW